MGSRRVSCVLLLGCSLSALIVSTASAQTAAAPTAVVAANPETASSSAPANVTEVVVTAQKRQERVQDVPIAITVVSGAQLARQQINTVGDLQRTAPSLQFAAPGQSPGGGGFVRGLGTVLSTQTAEASVGVVVDGVPQGNVATTNIFDVSRVEILRGPQGTLFGQSVSAGVVNITTNAPDFRAVSGSLQTELSGKGDAGSKYDRDIVRGVINIPLADNAAVRISSHYDILGGVAYNATKNEYDESHDGGVRARLLWEPGDNTTINIIADYDRLHDSNAPYFSYSSAPAGSELSTLLASCGATASKTNNTTCSPTSEYEESVNYGLSGEIDQKIGNFTLTSISAFREFNYGNATSIDGLPASSPLKISYGPSDTDLHQISQEIRLSSPSVDRLQFVVGGYYSKLYDNASTLNTLSLSEIGVNVPSKVLDISNLENEALFGQATYKVIPAFRLIAGIRLNHENTTENQLNQVTGVDYYNRIHTNNFSWRLGAQ